ncbi:hypothetical protein JVT61DRAFT_11414 [Boletus reticuloceps]|uniref:Integrase core domain-containing protein n=1 Tax=Boletus reticuloceps TaxID=495285 RepID=A0A8I3A461_9AGAM|nr:hypothetical protein JVT61DRAFT_11414 [Boletus reticuloceps]
MKVWHSNRNSQLILSYYLETVREFGFIPLVTQSDPGTENFGVANAQTLLRQTLDPSLAGFIQHRWMRQKKNVMPEIAWSQLRRRFTPGFENLLDEGVNAGWYDFNNTLQRMVFRWLFILWLQQALDAYVDRVNNTPKRRDHNKVLPHGVPLLIHTSSQNYGALDFKITVTPELINYTSQQYITPSHPVFDLVPPVLSAFIGECYDSLGRPPMVRTSVWQVYRKLLAVIQQRTETPVLLTAIATDPTNDPILDELHLLPDQEDLPFRDSEGDYYMGGIGGGMGLHMLLDNLVDEDEPNVEIDDVDAPPALLITAFSDEEVEVEDNIDEEA